MIKSKHRKMSNNQSLILKLLELALERSPKSAMLPIFNVFPCLIFHRWIISGTIKPASASKPMGYKNCTVKF